jgi:hypothetical protein
MKTNLMSTVMAMGLCCAPAPLLAANTRTISVNDVTVTEGQSALFVVTLSAKSSETITIDYHTRDGSACSSCFNLNVRDYFARAGCLQFCSSPPLQFKPGEVSKVVSVAVANDTCDEPDENFFLDLSNPTGPVSLGKGTGTCTIIDNDFSNLCCCQFFCLTRSSCCCGGVGEGIPAEASTPVGVPITYFVQWTVPPPDVWRSLTTMDVRLVGEDEEAILTVRWDEEPNTFSLLNPGNGEFQQTDVPGSPIRFEGSAVALLLENSEVIGSGPTGPSVVLNLNLIFKPLAAGQTFRVEARITNDAGIEKGYDQVGTITVQPR